ncbi:hypothetical protein OSTOST_17961 [Ostertagia ostertagi]
MEETFADAGVSITVTSLTDFISFAVGCATPFPSVQMFCAYAVTAVMFTYVYQLTFFAGIMVYTNRREMDNRNCITFRKIKKGLLFSGVTSHRFYDRHSFQKDRRVHMKIECIADYGSNLHVWMYNLSNVDIGPRRIWTVLDKEIELYEHTEFTGAADSWLRTYLAFTKQSGLLITQDNFVYILRNVFLSQPQFGKYRRDILFDASGSLLDASRVPIQLRHVGFANQSRAMQLFRKLAETSKLPTGVYADFFQVGCNLNVCTPLGVR